MKNYYEILEVNQKASDEIIKKIYKKQNKCLFLCNYSISLLNKY